MNQPSTSAPEKLLDGEAARALAQALEAEQTPVPPGPDRQKKKHSARQTALVAVFLAVVAALAVVCFTSIQYESRYLPRTELWGVDVSSLPPSEAEERLLASLGGVTVSLRDGETEIGTLPLGALVPEERVLSEARSCFAEQHRAAGFFGWLGQTPHVFRPALTGEIRAAEVLPLLRDALYGDTERVHPRDAYIELGEEGYALIPEENGNLVDLLSCAETTAAAVSGIDSLVPRTVPAEGEGLRLLPEITAGNRRLQRRCEVMDAWMATPVTLDFENGNEYTLTADDIWSVSDVTWTVTSARCAPDPEKTAALADELATEYASDGVYAKFKNVAPTRELIYYRVGDNGWILDRARLGEDMAEALSAGGGTVTPHYDYTWYWDSYYRCGNTFVEISLDNQYLWFFVDGDLVVETPVVTGDLSTRHETHRGFFRVVWKTSDLNLVGPTWDDHVDFWMPFDIPNEIGLHDSAWRDEYGGDIYITEGSHGCVNTPLEAMRIIYEACPEGVPVIVY